MTTGFPCPCCGKPLSSMPGDHVGQVMVWCAWGGCHSFACNDGEEAQTIAEVVRKLQVAYEKEECRRQGA